MSCLYYKSRGVMLHVCVEPPKRFPFESRQLTSHPTFCVRLDGSQSWSLCLI